MHRRTVLSSIAAVAGGLAGCGASGPDDPTTTRTETPQSTDTVRPAVAHTVHVETVRASGLTGRETRVVVGPNGQLAVVRNCEETTARRTRQLDPAAHDALVQAVLEADLGSMADTYECTGECPRDIPGRRYLLTVDGTVTNVFVEAQADTVPEGLVQIQQRLDTLRDGIETPSCETVDNT